MARVTMTPAEYAVWLCAACLAQMIRSPDDTLPQAERDQMRDHLNTVRDRMSQLARTSDDYSEILSHLDEVICYVHERLGLGTDCLLQASFLHQLLGISQAVEAAQHHPGNLYDKVGGRVDEVDLSPYEERDADHTTRTGDALSTCALCLYQLDVVTGSHLFLLEEMAGVDDSASYAITAEMSKALIEIQSTLKKASPADLTDDDFKDAVRQARKVQRHFIQLSLLDPLAAASERWADFKGTLRILVEDLQEAQQSPTGTRLS